MKQGNRDIISGSTLLILSILLYFVIPGQVETFESDSLSPAFLPLLMVVIIGVLSASLVYSGFSQKKREIQSKTEKPDESMAGETNQYKGLFHVSVAMGVMILYATLIPWAGYILSSAIALVCLALLYGNRSWKQILIIAAIAPPLFLLFFRYTLLVFLPQGKLFG